MEVDVRVEVAATEFIDELRKALRHLYASFAAASTTVGAFIRGRRLLHCREELRNPNLRKQPIIQIALKWGFSGSASFTRAYRAHFGNTPSEERMNS